VAKEKISKRLADRLKSARKSQGLSLEALEKTSGISRSMISQIERAESSPTVATMWYLTQALDVDFSSLLDSGPTERSPIKEIVRAEQTPIIAAQGQGCKIRILSAPETVGETEIYDLEFEPNGLLDSKPHRSGCVESLTVFSGKLVVTSDGVVETVSKGDTVRYIADRPHSIKSKGKNGRAILIVTGS